MARGQRTLKQMLGAQGISGSAVIPGSEQTFVPGPRRKRKLFDPATGDITVRARRPKSRTLYDMASGTAARRKTVLGVGQQTSNDPTIVVMKRKNQPKKHDWMQNQKVLNVVLSGLKAKGAVDAEGNPQKGVKRKKLTKRERALYNRLRLTGRSAMPEGGRY